MELVKQSEPIVSLRKDPPESFHLNFDIIHFFHPPRLFTILSIYISYVSYGQHLTQLHVSSSIRRLALHTMSRRAISNIPRTIASLSTPALRPSLSQIAARISRPAIAQSQRRGYHEKVLDHYSNPRNVGSMNKNDNDVGTGTSAFSSDAPSSSSAEIQHFPSEHIC